MIRFGSVVAFCYASIFLCSSCNKQPLPAGPQEAIAKVDNRILYESSIQSLIHPESNSEDSTAMATAYVDQWVRDQLLMREASRYFSSDFEIERLVDDYREQLLKYNLEDKISSERFDTSVNEGQMIQFYEEMKEDFILSESVYRATFIKFDRKTKSLSLFAKDWKKNDINAIRTFAAAFADEYKADTLMWHTWSTVKTWGKQLNQSLANKQKPQRQIAGDYEYYLKIHEVAAVDSVAPLYYVAAQLKRMLLHKRKQKMLESYKQELYEKALKDNVIRIY